MTDYMDRVSKLPACPVSPGEALQMISDHLCFGCGVSLIDYRRRPYQSQRLAEAGFENLMCEECAITLAGPRAVLALRFGSAVAALRMAGAEAPMPAPEYRVVVDYDALSDAQREIDRKPYGDRPRTDLLASVVPLVARCLKVVRA